MQSLAGILAHTVVIIAVTCVTWISCKPLVVNADQDCVRTLGQKLDKCLGQFESQLGFYKNMLTTDTQRETMASSLCHDYQEALMCVHQVLVSCEESKNHLDTVQKRLGRVREFMINVCAIGANTETDTSKTAGHVTPSTLMITRAKTEPKKTVTQTATETTRPRIKSKSNPGRKTNTLKSKVMDTLTKLPSSGHTEHQQQHQKPIAAASKSQKKIVKDRVNDILDCIKNRQENIPACVDYYFEKVTPNSGSSIQSLSRTLLLVVIAYMVWLC